MGKKKGRFGDPGNQVTKLLGYQVAGELENWGNWETGKLKPKPSHSELGWVQPRCVTSFTHGKQSSFNVMFLVFVSLLFKKKCILSWILEDHLFSPIFRFSSAKIYSCGWPYTGAHFCLQTSKWCHQQRQRHHSILPIWNIQALTLLVLQ